MIFSYKKIFHYIFCTFILIVGTSATVSQAQENDETIDSQSDPIIENDIGVYRNSDMGISLNVPAGWTAKKVDTGSRIAITAPSERSIMNEDFRYDPNIVIYRFDSEFDLNDKEMVQKKIDKFSKSIQSQLTVSDFKIGTYETVGISQDDDSLIYYTYYSASGIDFMQANLFIPGKDHYFYASYTDAAENIEGANSSFYMNTIWPSLASIRLDNPAPPPISKIKKTLPFILAFIFMFAVVTYMKVTNKRSMDIILSDEIDHNNLANDLETSSIKELNSLLNKIPEEGIVDSGIEEIEGLPEDDAFDDTYPQASKESKDVS